MDGYEIKRTDETEAIFHGSFKRADGVRPLAIGGVPGGVYSRPGDLELGAPGATAAEA